MHAREDSPYKSRGGLRRIGKAFIYSIDGLVNSAIEAAVDRISYDAHPLSKQAKDMGSAAQMLGLLNVAVIWSLVLVDLLSGRQP